MTKRKPWPFMVKDPVSRPPVDSVPPSPGASDWKPDPGVVLKTDEDVKKFIKENPGGWIDMGRFGTNDICNSHTAVHTAACLAVGGGSSDDDCICSATNGPL